MADFFEQDDGLGGARTLAMSHLCDWLDARAVEIRGRYPREEMRAWPQKIEAAHARQAGRASPHAGLIDQEATRRGITPDALAASVLAKLDAFAAVAPIIAAVRATAFDAFAAADSLDALAAAMADAQAQFSAAVAALAPPPP